MAATIFWGGFAMLDVEWKGVLLGVLIGTMMFIISHVTDEALGRGDCWIILFLSMSIGPIKAVGVLFISFLLSAIFGVLYMMLTVKK